MKYHLTGSSGYHLMHLTPNYLPSCQWSVDLRPLSIILPYKEVFFLGYLHF